MVHPAEMVTPRWLFYFRYFQGSGEAGLGGKDTAEAPSHTLSPLYLLMVGQVTSLSTATEQIQAFLYVTPLTHHSTAYTSHRGTLLFQLLCALRTVSVLESPCPESCSDSPGPFSSQVTGSLS